MQIIVAYLLRRGSLLEETGPSDVSSERSNYLPLSS